MGAFEALGDTAVVGAAYDICRDILMRLWTVHPKYLDSKGLVALWREALLARAVLKGNTKGYRNHPQLERFKSAADPIASLNEYLRVVLEESMRRGYQFDASKVAEHDKQPRIVETDGQLLYEWQHLRNKLQSRSLEKYAEVKDVKTPECHPLFRITEGKVRNWEKHT